MVKSFEERKKDINDELTLIQATSRKAGRDFTKAELDRIDELADQAVGLKTQMDRVERSEKAFAELVNFGGGDGDDDESGVKFFALSGSRGRKAASVIAAKMREGFAEHGLKAFPTAGTITTPTPLDPTPLEVQRVPNSILQLLRVRPRGTTKWMGIRQTGFTNNAQIVPAGATKPTSTIATENIEGGLSVIAHLSDPVDKYVLMDNQNLIAFVQNNLLWGLQLALEEEVLNGDGSEFTLDGKTGNHFTGILATDGIQLQAFGVDPITTLRSASTKLETIGFDAGAYVLNPTDWEGIETERNLSGNFDLGSAINRAERRVWGIRVVTSTRLPEGTALALDLNALNVDTDEDGIEIRWDGSGELFDKNQVKARVEGRFGFTVERPEGIVEIDLNGGS